MTRHNYYIFVPDIKSNPFKRIKKLNLEMMQIVLGYISWFEDMSLIIKFLLSVLATYDALTKLT